jgi:hypothetical protein
MKYFTLDEMIKSETAEKKGIKNEPTDSEKENLRVLIENVLDPVRETYGKPIYVSSGYRCAALNKAVGGAATSDHMKGMAADIKTGTRAGNKKVFNLIKANCKFKQLIDEKNFSWVHVSYDPANLKNQVLAL